MVRKTSRSKTHKRRHSRRHTRKNAALQFGGRGGMGGAELGHAYTSGASQELYQMTNRTPGISSGGGSKATKKRREQSLAVANAARKAQLQTKKRHNEFKKNYMGMPLVGYEGNQYSHLSRNEIKNKVKEEALSNYVRMTGNNNNFDKFNLKLNNNNINLKINNKNKNKNKNKKNNNVLGLRMGNNIIKGHHNPYLTMLREEN
jgi:hypothetical protein